jgi:hypothetical protein
MYEEITEYCMVIQHCLEQCKMFAKRDNFYIRTANGKNWANFLSFTSKTVSFVQQIANVDESGTA